MNATELRHDPSIVITGNTFEANWKGKALLDIAWGKRRFMLFLWLRRP